MRETGTGQQVAQLLDSYLMMTSDGETEVFSITVTFLTTNLKLSALGLNLGQCGVNSVYNCAIYVLVSVLLLLLLLLLLLAF
jgi:hypothetical protein